MVKASFRMAFAKIIACKQTCFPCEIEDVFSSQGCIREIAIICGDARGVCSWDARGSTVWPKLVVQTHHAHLLPPTAPSGPPRANPSLAHTSSGGIQPPAQSAPCPQQSVSTERPSLGSSPRCVVPAIQGPLPAARFSTVRSRLARDLTVYTVPGPVFRAPPRCY
jgi:hypothetical protein